MNNIFVNLTIKKYGDEEEFSLESALKKIDFVILLGNPGSGKTTLLNHFAQNSKTALYNIRDFLYTNNF